MEISNVKSSQNLLNHYDAYPVFGTIMMFSVPSVFYTGFL